MALMLSLHGILLTVDADRSTGQSAHANAFAISATLCASTTPQSGAPSLL